MGVLNSDKKRKTRRGKGGKYKQDDYNFKLLGTNANGLSSKKKSFLDLIKKEEPMCFLVQETHFKREGSFKIKGYTGPYINPISL